MLEFGSDFHHVKSYCTGHIPLSDTFENAILLADGRQCIVALVRQYRWRRIWMPDYFCYEVIESIKEQTGIEIMFYMDNPLEDGNVDTLLFKPGDVLLRMNYFGLRDVRFNTSISIPVIEDHTHSPFGPWALNSDADWCVSSIRKTLPIPEGGVMWSPKGHRLTIEIPAIDASEEIAKIRWIGMEMKADYLAGRGVSKEEFRKKYTETEEWFNNAEPSLIDERTRLYLDGVFDYSSWFEAKQRNWSLLKELISPTEKIRVLSPESPLCAVFSLALLFENKDQRDNVRMRLIENSVYPAILWTVPRTASEGSRRFSERMLSIHCDGRYNENEIRQLAEIINKVLV